MIVVSLLGLVHTSAELWFGLSRSNWDHPAAANTLLAIFLWASCLKVVLKPLYKRKSKPDWGLSQQRPGQTASCRTGVSHSSDRSQNISAQQPGSGSQHITILNQRMSCAAFHSSRLVTDTVGHIRAAEMESVPQNMCHWIPAHMCWRWRVRTGSQ